MSFWRWDDGDKSKVPNSKVGHAGMRADPIQRWCAAGRGKPPHEPAAPGASRRFRTRSRAASRHPIQRHCSQGRSKARRRSAMSCRRHARSWSRSCQGSSSSARDSRASTRDSRSWHLLLMTSFSSSRSAHLALSASSSSSVTSAGSAASVAGRATPFSCFRRRFCSKRASGAGASGCG